MQTSFEHFALASMMGQADTPPKANGSLCFHQPWERQAFGLAVALARDGHFEWEEFRQALIAEIIAWEASHARDDPEWDYYECWLDALERVMRSQVLPGLATADPAGRVMD
ncbi:nitrile hydratase accessory protein [Methylobacterium sp. WL19]|uniref:nitrile hydratase accessory protein n=1 Tax=Methylobacterium sp. WL19 TaxID=2603896 RepID=UPI0011CB0A69|nr:nitrile hydratase accessory protein [Methylobacterium sp. WL19]TXN27434.1 nitrile hydratase accessory protein [Methylobacterium sp. WL19]